MKPGVLFFVISDIKDYLTSQNLLRNDGTVLLNDVQKDLALAGIIDQSLKAHGVDIPDQFDRVIAALPLIVGVFVH